jgi:hypothetical protein
VLTKCLWTILSSIRTKSSLFTALHKFLLSQLTSSTKSWQQGRLQIARTWQPNSRLAILLIKAFDRLRLWFYLKPIHIPYSPIRWRIHKSPLTLTLAGRLQRLPRVVTNNKLQWGTKWSHSSESSFKRGSRDKTRLPCKSRCLLINSQIRRLHLYHRFILKKETVDRTLLGPSLGSESFKHAHLIS